MDRTGHVARTYHGETNVNKLRVPEFGVRDFRLKVGDKSSKCYRPKQSPAPQPDAGGTDDFHFVPEKETLDITYELFDPYGNVEEATLELYCRFDDKPLWKLDLTKVGDDCLAHGKHVLKWDGRIIEGFLVTQTGTVKAGALEHDLTKVSPKKTPKVFPDGFVTLEHTPYKLKLTVSNKTDKIIGNPATGWTYFHLLVKKIEFEIGPAETVPKVGDNDRLEKDKAVRKQVADDGGVPAKDAADPRKVFLISNLYKTASTQMADDTGFTVYKTEWGDGPNIPLVAKIRMADSADQEVKLDEDKGAVALGNVKFLWDWEDPDEDTARQTQPRPKSFIADAINYDKAVTKPKGDNCHLDRGGKRGTGSTPVFPDQAGYDAKDTLDAGKFPFKVEAWKDVATATRKWASTSTGWTTGKLKGKTGVVFQPSRMAGDDYKITVYLAYDKSDKDKLVLDADTEPLKAPAAIKASTGTFQTWREIHLARYVVKKSSVVAFLPANLAGVRGHFDEPYIGVDDKMDADNKYALTDHCTGDGNPLDYNAKCEAVLTGSGNVMFTSELALVAGADHASEDCAFKVRTYPEFVRKLHGLLSGAPGASDFSDWATAASKTEDELASGLASDALTGQPAARGTRLTATKTWLNSNGFGTDALYAAYLDDKLCTFIETQLATDFELIKGHKSGKTDAAVDGITIIHFNTTNTYLRDQIAGGSGWGAILGSAVDPSDAGRDKCAFLYLSPRLDTFVHEIGHHMFLPHAPTAGGFIAARHDDADGNCMMSYSRPRPSFCGLCQLRLRGWTSGALNKTSANNKKP